jgi:hypothetical protein
MFKQHTHTNHTGLLLTTLLALLFFTECQGQQPEKSKSGNQTLGPQQADSLPIAKTRKQYKQYGEYKLERQQVGNYMAEIQNGDTIIKIEEIKHGILFFYKKICSGHYCPTTLDKIVYYDSLSQALIKVVYLNNLTPYNKNKYKNILIGSLDYEYGEVTGPDSNCVWPKASLPNSYYTQCVHNSISMDSYLCLNFELIKMTNFKRVVGWEQTLMVFDPTGNEVFMQQMPHECRAYVLNNGTYLCLTDSRGLRTSSEPFSSCQAFLQIYDLKTKTLVYKYNAGKKSISGDIFWEDRLIYYSTYNETTDTTSEFLIDVEKKETSHYKFKWEHQFMPERDTYKAFLKTLLPTKEKF